MALAETLPTPLTLPRTKTSAISAQGGNAEDNAQPSLLQPSLRQPSLRQPSLRLPSLLLPTVRGGVRVPGLPQFPLGVERYVVKGGGNLAIDVLPDDVLTFVNEEGLQPANLAAFALEISNGNKKNNHAQKSDAGLIGAATLPEGESVATFLRPSDARAPRDKRQENLRENLREKLKARGCDLHTKTREVFSSYGRAGEQKTFTVRHPALLLLCAQGRDLTPHESTSPSSVLLYVKRASDRASDEDGQKAPFRLPPPLADPQQDFTIMPGEARAYVVKKGQLVQILDVRGRECSDFQAFDLRALEQKRLRDIDPTTTRSLTGSLYPNPGLFAKYFSVDHKALVEIVQDTVGRHDSFNLACTARYYEDAGYPGHVNCSDNLNIQAEPYEIDARAGWPAINFFFNTMLDADHCLLSDEPWSRPGDYVLLRALEDLVCFSTACPCDIDAANGWKPTEVQVRVYDNTLDDTLDHNTPFAQGTGVRMTTQSDVELTKQTAFHDRFAQRTRNFTNYNGYWLADDFTGLGAISEYWACREKVIVTDLSPLRKYEILGPDAENLMQWCATRNMKRLGTGQVVYTAMCYEHGGMIDDGTVLRLGEHNFRWIGGCDDSGLWLKEQARKRNLDVWIKNTTDQLHNIAVQGPKSREVLKPLFWTAPQQPTIEELGWFRFSVARLSDFHGAPVVVSRTGYTGELGYEIFCHPKDAGAVFDAVWQEGEKHGMSPLGLSALDLVRIEAGLVFAGSEFCDRTDPFEAGIGFTVPLKSKQDDFCGRAALERRKASPQRKLVGLETESALVPSGGDCVREGRAQIGEITSAMRSPILGKTIALARLEVDYAVEGREVEIGQLDGHQKRIPARVVPFPFYDPKKERVRA